MAGFPQGIIDQAWKRCGGFCECTETTHGHYGQCHKTLLDYRAGDRTSAYGWEAHSMSGKHLDSLSDCKIYCWEPCHRLTL